MKIATDGDLSALMLVFAVCKMVVPPAGDGAAAMLESSRKLKPSASDRRREGKKLRAYFGERDERSTSFEGGHQVPLEMRTKMWKRAADQRDFEVGFWSSRHRCRL